MAEDRVIRTSAGEIETRVAGAGPAVLAIHGTPGGAGQGMAFAAHFREAGLRVIASSRPGYGATPLDAGKGFDEAADLLAALLDDLGVAQAAVYAVSGGGPTALQFALRHPARTGALLLEDALLKPWSTPISLQISDEVMFSAPMRALFAKQAEHDPASAIGAILGSTSTLEKGQVAEIAHELAGDGRTADWLRELVPNLAAGQHHHGYRNDTRQFANPPKAPLEEIAPPALICHGEADSEVPIEHATEAAERIPGAELELVPEAGHILALSRSGAAIQERQIAFAREHLA